MKHSIDPLVDCVFKTILGSEENKELLIHFLNAVMKPTPEYRIDDVDIQNPFNERKFKLDKLTIVDLKAKDQLDNYYQIEVQLSTHPTLIQRMLFTWSSIYHSLIDKGEQYSCLKPVISIWILNDNLFPDVKSHHLPFGLYNIENNLFLTDHMSIHLLQLQKWEWTGEFRDELDRWMYTFKEGKNLDIDNPPEILRTREMKKVMDVMRRFSENETDYHLYESRRIAHMEANAIKEWKAAVTAEIEAKDDEIESKTAELEMMNSELETKGAELETKKAELERERKEKEEQRQKREQLEKLLKQMGVDPDQQS